jgi:hypothetical protein
VVQFYNDLVDRLKALDFCRGIPYVAIIERDLGGSVSTFNNYFVGKEKFSDFYVYKENPAWEEGGVRKSYKSNDYPDRLKRFMSERRIHFDPNFFTLSLPCTPEHSANPDLIRQRCGSAAAADANNAIDTLRIQADTYGWDDKRRKYTGKFGLRQDDLIVTLQMLVYHVQEFLDPLKSGPSTQLQQFIAQHAATHNLNGTSILYM